MPPRDGWSWRDRVLGLAGAALLLAAAGVHLDLYLTGYRNIPTIGVLFLVQVASALVLSVAVVVTVSLPMRSLRAPAAAGAAVFAAGTVAAYGVSRVESLFGFREHPTTAGLVAGLLEAGAFVALGSLAGESMSAWPGPRRTRTAAPLEATGDPQDSARARRRWHARPVGLGIVAAALVGVVLAAGIGPASAPVAPSAAATASPVPVVHVVISDYAFHPARVVARPGAVVTVTNKDRVAHTMTAVTGSARSGRFNTGSVNPGQTVRIHAPKAVGSYKFYCSIHPFMTGVLLVSR